MHAGVTAYTLGPSVAMWGRRVRRKHTSAAALNPKPPAMGNMARYDSRLHVHLQHHPTPTHSCC
jgi:hypothetical protein